MGMILFNLLACRGWKKSSKLFAKSTNITFSANDVLENLFSLGHGPSSQ